ncbi:Mobile element protein [Salmonella enterica]|nr:Mobile element protein [Salmonella enterica]
MLSYYTLNRSYIYSTSSARFINKDFEMFKFVKIAVVAGVLATLTACTGHIENKKK